MLTSSVLPFRPNQCDDASSKQLWKALQLYQNMNYFNTTNMIHCRTSNQRNVQPRTTQTKCRTLPYVNATQQCYFTLSTDIFSNISSVRLSQQTPMYYSNIIPILWNRFTRYHPGLHVIAVLNQRGLILSPNESKLPSEFASSRQQELPQPNFWVCFFFCVHVHLQAPTLILHTNIRMCDITH